jgi:hypothetical protein
MTMRTLAAACCALVSLAGAGCTFAVPERKLEPAVHAQRDVAVTSNQLRLRMRALVGPMTGQIEQAADQIIAATTDDAVKRAALRWKIEAVPALRRALFEADPFAAVIDTWVLFNQMADYFEHGPGKEALADSAEIAVAACRRMEAEFTRIVASMTISGDVSRARTFARKWGAEHPIRQSIAGRETALGRVLERDAASFHSTGEIVAGATTAIDDLGRRLEIYSDQLFRQARWEAESLRSVILSDLKMDRVLPLAERAVDAAERAVATVDRLASIGHRAAGVVEGVPKLLGSERDAVITVLQDELTRTIAFVREERIVALEHLTSERVAALNEMREALVEERKALTQEMEHISLKVVDHAFWRAAQLLTLLVVALFVALAAALVALRHSRDGAKSRETAGIGAS